MKPEGPICTAFGNELGHIFAAQSIDLNFLDFKCLGIDYDSIPDVVLKSQSQELIAGESKSSGFKRTKSPRSTPSSFHCPPSCELIALFDTCPAFPDPFGSNPQCLAHLGTAALHCWSLSSVVPHVLFEDYCCRRARAGLYRASRRRLTQGNSFIVGTVSPLCIWLLQFLRGNCFPASG